MKKIRIQPNRNVVYLFISGTPAAEERPWLELYAATNDSVRPASGLPEWQMMMRHVTGVV